MKKIVRLGCSLLVDLWDRGRRCNEQNKALSATQRNAVVEGRLRRSLVGQTLAKREKEREKEKGRGINFEFEIYERDTGNKSTRRVF